MQLDIASQLAAINAVLDETRRLNSPASEIASVRFADPAGETIEVKAFGMNSEPLTFLVSVDPMDEEVLARLTEGTTL